MGRSKEWWLCWCKRAERSYSTFKVRRGGREEIPLVQGKEQWLRFAAKIRETQVRRYVLQERIRGQTH